MSTRFPLAPLITALVKLYTPPVAPRPRAALDEVYLHEDPIVPTKLRAALNEVYRLRKVLAAADHVIYTANMCRGFCDGCHSGCDVCDALKEYERVKKT